MFSLNACCNCLTSFADGSPVFAIGESAPGGILLRECSDDLINEHFAMLCHRCVSSVSEGGWRAFLAKYSVKA